MISERQLDGYRRNAKSNGPKTPEGRAALVATLAPQAQLALIVLDDDQDADTIGKMSRFERSFLQCALKELRRLQARRTAVCCNKLTPRSRKLKKSI